MNIVVETKPLSHPTQLRGPLGRKVAVSTGLNMLQQVVLLVGNVFVARMVGPEAMGAIAYASAFVGVFTALSDLGYGTAHIKRLSEGRDIGECMGMAWLTRAICLSIMVACVLVTISLAPSQIATSEHKVLYYISLATLVFAQVSMVPNATFTAFQNVVHKDLPPVIIQVIGTLLRVVVAILGFGIVWLATTDLIAALLLVMVQLWLLRKIPIRWPSFTTFKSYSTYGMPTILIVLVTSLGDRIDRLWLQSFAGDVALGQYAAGMRLGAVLQFLSGAVAGLIFPSISRAYAEGRAQDAFVLCDRAERRLALALFPCMLGLACISHPLALLLLGQRYADTGPVIAFGTVAMIFQALSQPPRQLIGGAERMKLNIILNIVLVANQAWFLYIFLGGIGFRLDYFGGAAARVAIAEALSSFINYVFCKLAVIWFMKGNSSVRISIHIISAMCLFFASYTVSIIVKPINIWLLFLIAPFIAILQLLVMRYFSELENEEIQFFVSIIPISRFMNRTV